MGMARPFETSNPNTSDTTPLTNHTSLKKIPTKNSLAVLPLNALSIQADDPMMEGYDCHSNRRNDKMQGVYKIYTYSYGHVYLYKFCVFVFMWVCVHMCM